MNIIRNVEGRIGAAIAAVVIGSAMLICGGSRAFVVSPQQALEWRRIQALPEIDANGLASTATGKEVAITGTLNGNEALTDDDLVLFERSRWDVRKPSDNNN